MYIIINYINTYSYLNLTSVGITNKLLYCRLVGIGTDTHNHSHVYLNHDPACVLYTHK